MSLNELVGLVLDPNILECRMWMEAALTKPGNIGRACWERTLYFEASRWRYPAGRGNGLPILRETSVLETG